MCESLLDLSGAVHGSIGTHVLHGSVALATRSRSRVSRHDWGARLSRDALARIVGVRTTVAVRTQDMCHCSVKTCLRAQSGLHGLVATRLKPSKVNK